MGGTKKKPIAQVEKAQAQAQKLEKKEKEAKTGPGQKAKLAAVFRVDEKQALKSLSSLRAITIYGAAKALSVNASVASSLLRSLESKNLIKKVGGSSGHYVYSSVSS